MNFLDSFLDWSASCLQESDDAREYLTGRGVSESQWVRHRIGYSGGDFAVNPLEDPGHCAACSDKNRRSEWCDSCRFTRWSTLWVKEDGGDEDGPKTAIVGRRLSGCVVFPLTNYVGRPVGIQIRSISEKSYDTFLLKRRPEGYFFGLAANIESIWSRREVFLVEGSADHLILERLVAPNVLALMTSAVNMAQRRFLNRFVSTVNMCLDMDAAGRHGVRQFLKHEGDNFLVRNVRYPKVKDGDTDLNDFWRRSGDDAFKRYFQKQVLSTF